MAGYEDLGGRYSDYVPTNYEDHKVCTPECAEKASPCPPQLGQRHRRPQPLVACPHCKAPAGVACTSGGRHPRRLEQPHPSRTEAA